jgi:hypothetical protein
VGLLLALVDLPDFGTPLSRIAGSVEKIAANESPPTESLADEAPVGQPARAAEPAIPAVSKPASAPTRGAKSHV